MLRRYFLLVPFPAACQPKPMDFDFYYAFSDGTPQTHTQLTIEGARATLVRQTAGAPGEPIGVWRKDLDAATLAPLADGLPAKAPAGPPLAPGMPNHLFRMKRNGTERLLRLAHEPEILEQVRPFVTTLERTIARVAEAPYRTLSIRGVEWTTDGLALELTAGGTQALLIPDAAQAIQVRTTGQVFPAPAGPVRLAPGQTERLQVRVPRQAGAKYQVFFQRTGTCQIDSAEMFGSAFSALAPQ